MEIQLVWNDISASEMPGSESRADQFTDLDVSALNECRVKYNIERQVAASLSGNAEKVESCMETENGGPWETLMGYFAIMRLMGPLGVWWVFDSQQVRRSGLWGKDKPKPRPRND